MSGRPGVLPGKASNAREHLPLNGEDDLVARISSRWAGAPARRGTLGIGDDAAVIPTGGASSLLVSTDLFVEGVHFDRRTTPDVFVGRKALATAASDIGAMGGSCLACLLSLAAPPRCPARRLEAILASFHEEAVAIGIPLVGGDLSRCREGLTLDVVVIGRPSGKKVLRRGGARAGHGLFVTGPLGGSAAGLARLRAGARPWKRALRAPRSRAGRYEYTLESLAVMAHLRPRPPLALAAAFGASGAVAAMMDISDGLAVDLRRMCRASGAGARLDAAAVPLHPAAVHFHGFDGALDLALGGGEDYELLLAAAPRHETLLRKMARRAGADLFRVGEVRRQKDGLVLASSGRAPRPLPNVGFDHFERA